MATNIVTAVFDGCGCAQTETVFQYDYGQILKIEGVELPQSYEVHFSNDRYGGETTTQIGGADGVNIPDAYLQSGQMVYAFIFLHAGADDGETEYVITIPVAKRPEITDEVPTPAEQSAITQAIAALNAAVEQTAQDAETASQGASDAQGYAESAQASAQSASASAQEAQEIADELADTIGTAVEEYLEEHPITAPVQSVNTKTGDVVLSASDVHALPDSTVIPTKTSDLTNDSGYITSVPVQSVNGKTGAVSLNASDVGALPSSTTIPTKTSQLQNDSGFISSAPVSSVNGQTGDVTITASGLGAYVKPTGGIPKTDLASAVQTSLGKADTALQSAPVTSVNSKTGAVTLTASDVGALSSSTTYVSSVNGNSGAVTISNATTSSAGLMSATDKANLDAVVADYSSALVALNGGNS